MACSADLCYYVTSVSVNYSVLVVILVIDQKTDDVGFQLPIVKTYSPHHDCV
jgi:hypothetical protein